MIEGVYFSAIAVLTRELEQVQDLTIFVNRCGFDVIERIDGLKPSQINIDSNSQEQWSVFFIADIMPLPVCPFNGNIENTRIFVLHKEWRKQMRKDSSMIVATEHHAQSLANDLLSDVSQREITEILQNSVKQYETTDDIVSVLANAIDDKVELILRDGKKCIKKTYRHWALAKLHREIDCRRALAHIEEVTPIIEHGKNYIVMPYYEHTFFHAQPFKPLPVKMVKEILQILEKIWNNGYAILDNHPSNFLYLVDGSIKMIDFEYTVQHGEPDKKFSDSFFFSHEKSSLAKTINAPWRSWKKTWFPLTGVEYNNLKMGESSILHRGRMLLGGLLRTYTRRVRKISRIQARKKISTISGWHYLHLKKRYFF